MICRRRICGMTELSTLPPGERAKRYRELAKETERLAAKVEGRTQDAYKLIAEQWHKLADEVMAGAK
jgi:hypothetical protein